MTTATNVQLSTPVRAPLAVLLRITDEQTERLGTLIADFSPATVLLHLDSWMEDAVLFTLQARDGSTILNGLIEPDGRSHT
jgi:hypothetical protein